MAQYVIWLWIDRDGRDVSGTDAVAGYNVGDYFDADIETTLMMPHDVADATLRAAYKGPDSDGIGLRWSIIEDGV